MKRVCTIVNVSNLFSKFTIMLLKVCSQCAQIIKLIHKVGLGFGMGFELA
jgi:hypothetical protein